jgi:formiminotetrahydrofolate cyclodeaminase
MASALAEMVCNFTVGRAKYAAFDQPVRESLERATALRLQSLEDADADAEAYGAVAAALKLSRASETEQRDRRVALERALRRAADVPMGVAERCGDILALVEGLKGKSNTRVASDLHVAETFAIAAFESALANVKINVDLMTDAAAKERYLERMRAAQVRVSASRPSSAAHVAPLADSRASGVTT